METSVHFKKIRFKTIGIRHRCSWKLLLINGNLLIQPPKTYRIWFCVEILIGLRVACDASAPLIFQRLDARHEVVSDLVVLSINSVRGKHGNVCIVISNVELFTFSDKFIYTFLMLRITVIFIIMASFNHVAGCHSLCWASSIRHPIQLFIVGLLSLIIDFIGPILNVGLTVNSIRWHTLFHLICLVTDLFDFFTVFKFQL